MGKKYKKVLAYAGPVLVPLVAAGIRHLLKRRSADAPAAAGEAGEARHDRTSAVDDVVNTVLDGVSSLLGGSIRRGAGRR